MGQFGRLLTTANHDKLFPILSELPRLIPYKSLHTKNNIEHSSQCLKQAAI